MLSRLMVKLDKVIHFERAQAHCDIPCGVYDPIVAQIAAMTRMTGHAARTCRPRKK